MRGVVAIIVLATAALAAESPESIAERAAQKIQAGDFAGAASLLRPLVREKNAPAELWNLLGVCESELHRDEAARSAFTTGLRLAPSSLALNENAGLFHFRAGEYSEAVPLLSKALTLGSDKPGVAFSLAASLLRTGAADRALAILVKLEPALSGEAAYWSERGWAEMRSDTGRAAASFERALALAPDDVRALNGAASAAEAANDDEKALALLLRARKASPNDIRILLHFGSVCLKRDLSVDALDAIERAYKLAPDNNLALFLNARAQISIQQWQFAHDLLTEFDRRVPRYAPAQYALGWLDLKLNRNDEARQHLTASLGIDPQLHDARFELGSLELAEGHIEEAEALLETVLNNVPNHAKANIALGDVLLRKGDIEGARKQYEAAIATDPKMGPAHYKLSTVLIRLGDTERAASERETGAALNADALRAAKTVLVLAEPDGTLLTGDPRTKAAP